MDYKVELDVYAGPLDLLLYLIRRDEIDIYDIPIARVTEQYLATIDLMQSLDINVAGEFMVMAATLLEMKSRMLLPQAAEEDDEEGLDPRLALVHQLLEYKKYRDAAGALEGLLSDRQKMFRRGADDRGARQEESVQLDEVSIWDLFGAFDKVLTQLGAGKAQIIFDDDVAVSVHMEQIINVLTSVGEISFFKLFEGASGRATLMGVFLGILELVRLKRITVSQPAPFGDIFLMLRNETNGG